MLPSLVWRGVTLASLRCKLWVSVTDSGIKVRLWTLGPVSRLQLLGASHRPVQMDSICFSTRIPHCPSFLDSEGETSC